MSNFVNVSPGIYTQEIDLTTVTRRIGLTSLGLVGETQRGPAFEPFEVNSYDDFVAVFGGLNPEKFRGTQLPKYELPYIAKAYFSQADRLFVTRVLGYSGYDAGKAWVLKTIGQLDPTTISTPSSPTTTNITFSMTGTSGNYTFTSISSNPFTNGNLAGESLLSGYVETLKTQLLATTETTSGNTYGTKVGYLTTGENSISASTIYNDAMFVDTNITNYTGGTERFTTAWINSFFSYVDNSSSYTGRSCGIIMTGLTSITNGFSGTIRCNVYALTGACFPGYNGLTIATLRSDRTSFNTSTDRVTGTTNAITVGSQAVNNALADFTITYNDGSTLVTNTISFDKSKASYIGNVLSNFPKEKGTALWLEEAYPSLVSYGYNRSYIRGISTSVGYIAGGASVNSLGNFKTKFKSPATPYIVSELRGSNTIDLFRFITISDGDNANTLVKVSITNISFERREFDVIVRDFNDTDNSVRILESYTRCNLDPTSNNYIALKIGTNDGNYQIRSKYIMVEMNYDAPIDAVACGFKGYQVRNYVPSTGTFSAPSFLYKTKYNQNGDVIFVKPISVPTTSTDVTNSIIISNGDNKRTTYLGVSNTIGYDPDMVEFKGNYNAVLLGKYSADGASFPNTTKGFHMDKNASTTTFEVGAFPFTSEADVVGTDYELLRNRKFTLVFAGGFDGWDIYRNTRTYSDNYTNKKTTYISEFSSWDTTNNVSDYYAFFDAIDKFSNPEQVDINVFATPGIDYVNNSGLVEKAIDMVENDRRDSLYIVTTPDFNLLQSSIDSSNIILPQEAVNNLEDSGIDSNYTATYYPWIQVNDAENNTRIYLPPTGEVIKNIALTDKIAHPWFATAGETRGIVDAIQTRVKLKEVDRDVLYLGNINPIQDFTGVGIRIWGNKTLQVKETALNRINVRRLLLQTSKLISLVGKRILFEQLDEQLRIDFQNSINATLSTIKRDRGLTDFRVVISNSPEDIDRNEINGRILLKPTRSLEYINIGFVITNTGANFDEI